jgi:UDP:flavonoid glycosyltransferase YjiC (YdhE family)
VDDSPWLDIVPPSMAGVGRNGWLLRSVPYNGGGVLSDWVMRQPERPRVAVTLGTIVPRMGGVGVVERIVALAPEVDAEFVLAMQPRDSDKLGRLPANVRAAGWMPMNALLRTCTAVVHHGGSGTMYAALDAGVPQLLLPSGAEDRHINAAAVLDRGAGLACAPEQIDTTVLQRLITDDSVRATTAEVRAELAEMPPPSALVERLEALTH